MGFFRRVAGPPAGAAAGLALAALLPPVPLAAHGSVPSGPSDVWNHWGLEPLVVLGIAVPSFLYFLGVRRLWAHAGRGRVVSRRRVAAFMAGVSVLMVALLSPLDPLGELLFSAHMVQHVLLVLAAAPLLVLGAPEVATLWAFDERWRGRLGRGWSRLVRRLRGASSPGGEARIALPSVLVAALTLWAWHLPALYDLAVRVDSVHALEHISFLATAVLFWAAVLRLRPRDRLGNGLRVVYVFFMAVQGSVLGALITFADRPLYESHAGISEAVWGIRPLVDQQLAGLIMWVPPALLYIATAAWLFVSWLEAVGERTRERERRRSVAGRAAGAAQ